MATTEENEQKVLTLLNKKGECTTSEIEEHFRKGGENCPDGAVKLLMRMKVSGLVKGRMDREKRGWVWSIQQVAAVDCEKV